MKKRSIAAALIFALLLAMFSTVAVFAEGDDHGADAHSDSMSTMEDEDYEGELTFQEEIMNAVMTYAPYVIGAVLAIIVVVVFIKIISRNRKPKYTGKH